MTSSLELEAVSVRSFNWNFAWWCLILIVDNLHEAVQFHIDTDSNSCFKTLIKNKIGMAMPNGIENLTECCLFTSPTHPFW